MPDQDAPPQGPDACAVRPAVALGGTAPDNAVEQRLLRESRVIAVIGLSTQPLKDSQIVSRHMQRNGYRIVPIHPKADLIMGEHAYPSLGALPKELAEQVDIVNIFRPPHEVPDIVEEALRHLPHLKGIWAQKAIPVEDVSGKLQARGIAVVADRCIRTQHLYGKFVVAGDDAP